jgi:cell division inhibitor SulA
MEVEEVLMLETFFDVSMYSRLVPLVRMLSQESGWTLNGLVWAPPEVATSNRVYRDTGYLVDGKTMQVAQTSNGQLQQPTSLTEFLRSRREPHFVGFRAGFSPQEQISATPGAPCGSVVAEAINYYLTLSGYKGCMCFERRATGAYVQIESHHPPGYQNPIDAHHEFAYCLRIEGLDQTQELAQLAAGATV